MNVTELHSGDRVRLKCPTSRTMHACEAVFLGEYSSLQEAAERVKVADALIARLQTGAWLAGKRFALFQVRQQFLIPLVIAEDGSLREEEGKVIEIAGKLAMGKG